MMIFYSCSFITIIDNIKFFYGLFNISMCFCFSIMYINPYSPPLRLSENSFFKFSGHIILLLFMLFITIFCGLDYPIFSFRTVSPPHTKYDVHSFTWKLYTGTGSSYLSFTILVIQAILSTILWHLFHAG